MLFRGAPVKQEPAWHTNTSEAPTQSQVKSELVLVPEQLQGPGLPTEKQLEISSSSNPKRSARKPTKSTATRVKQEPVGPKDVFDIRLEGHVNLKGQTNNELVPQPSAVSAPPAKSRKISSDHPNRSGHELEKSENTRIKRNPALEPKVRSEGQMRDDEVNNQLVQPNASASKRQQNISSVAHDKGTAAEVIKSENSESHIRGSESFEKKLNSVRSEAEVAALYAGHELKDEVVVGPLTLQHPDVVYAMIDAQRSNTASPAPRQICSVKLERMSVDTELSECRVGQNTYKIRPSGLPGQSIRDKIASLFESEPEEGPDEDAHEQVSSDDDGNSREEVTSELEFEDQIDPPTYNPVPHRQKGRRRQKPPYKCELCEKVYKRRYFLKRHIYDTHMTNGIFKCKDCGHEFSRINTFRWHLMTHTGEKPHKCKLCSYACIRKEQLKTHERGHMADKQFECNQCDFKTKYSQSIYQHLVVHTDEKPFKCDQCDYVAKSSRNLERHNKAAHVGVKRFKCKYSFCSYSSSWKTELRKHQKTHTNDEKPYQCSQCDYRGAKHHFIRHLLTHNAEKNIKCDKCDYKTHDIYYLQKHKVVHADEKPFKCTRCDFRTKHDTGLATHMKTHTSNEKPFKCSQCNYESRQLSNLQRHQMRHTGEKPFQCDQCDFKCSMKKNLQRHQLTHTDLKPFACDQCDYRGNSQDNLACHKKKHTGEKRFKCTECDYASISKYCLNLHLMKHTGEKPFACDLCEYRTNSKLSLQAHLKIHIGRKPFKCDICEYASITKTALRRHMLIHIGQKNYKCSTCSYTCYRQDYLVAHEKRHLNDELKPYACEMCNFRTMNAKYLENHVKHIHTKGV